MPPVLHVLCNVTILSRNHYSRFVLFVKKRKRAAPPFGGAARRASAQPEQRLHPQPELVFEFELEVPPTLPHEPQPHRRQHPQPVDAPQTEPQLQLLPVEVDVPATVPLCCVQVQVQVQVGFVVDVPPTEPVVCLQQGLQHRCWTKSGNVRPLKQPLQEEAILYPSIKDPGTSVPASFYAASARTVPKNSKTRTAGAVRESDAKIERKLSAWRTAARGELPSSRTSFFPSFSDHGSGSRRLSAWRGTRG